MDELMEDIELNSLKPRYEADGFNDLVETPTAPCHDLINFDDYLQQNIHFKRMRILMRLLRRSSNFGVKQRTKSIDRFIEELDYLYSLATAVSLISQMKISLRGGCKADVRAGKGLAESELLL